MPELMRVVPLLAAPESGLSTGAASEILRGINLNDTKRRDLIELRIRRMRECVAGHDAEERLAEVDASSHGHPWLDEVTKL